MYRPSVMLENKIFRRLSYATRGKGSMVFQAGSPGQGVRAKAHFP